METKRVCPGCQKELPPDVPLGLCPECLLKAGFQTGTQPDTEGSGFVPPTIEEIGKLFPQLEILALIGKGGMGAVYKARQRGLDRMVALKVLPPAVANTPGFPERFNREARALAKLVHPNIVTVHDFGQAGDLHFLIMEFVDGANLREVERAKRLSPDQALAIVPQICEALQFAHNAGIVHRDIKPENILMDASGRVKITDFGIAKMVGLTTERGSLTGAKDVIGTPHYMAPEQVEHPADVDHRADIFSLGVVFYEMLTGELPLGKFAPPSKKVRMDVRLDEVVLHALEKEPERRYQQASHVKTEVQMIAETPPPIGGAPSGSVATNLPRQTRSAQPKVTAPAVALMVGAMLKILSAFSFSILLAGGSGWLSRFLGPMHLFGGWWLGSVTLLSLVLFNLIPAALVLYGGYQMLHRRSYAWSMAAAIISIVSCGLLSLALGLWALIVLCGNDAKAEFGFAAPSASPTNKPDRFWRRFAVVIACIILIPIALTVLAILLAMILPAASRASQLTPAQLTAAGIRHEAGEYKKDFTQSGPLAADGRFSLDDINGRVEIHGWTSNAVLISAVVHGKNSEAVNAVNVKVDSSPAEVKVHTTYPNRNGADSLWDFLKGKNRNVAVDYTVHVPEGANLKEINSVNGQLTIDKVLGAITASTVNGEVVVADASRDLKLSTVNGPINARMNSLDDGQTVSLDSVNGRLELALPTNASAHFSVDTLNGGISSEFASLVGKRQGPVGSKLNGQLGTGAARVTINTVNGGVSFIKNPASPSDGKSPPTEERKILEEPVAK
jgi:predicted Ser/Thr protein kinase